LVPWSVGSRVAVWRWGVVPWLLGCRGAAVSRACSSAGGCVAEVASLVGGCTRRMYAACVLRWVVGAVTWPVAVALVGPCWARWCGRLWCRRSIDPCG
jgi:hypothetical protein